jgi:Mitotic checkpoint protein
MQIMHFAMNPAAMVEKEREEKVALSFSCLLSVLELGVLDVLRCRQRAKRIQELEEQVRLLTMQRGGVKDDISGASMAVVTSSEGEDHKLQLQRMKEVFRKKFFTFRDGVYMLTGYKVREMAGFLHKVFLYAGITG